MGAGDPEIDALLTRILAPENYRLLVRDTLIAQDDTLRGPVLALGGRLIVEGVVLGDLVAVDANLFLRPMAVVTGDVANIAGGYYPSALAQVGGTVLDRPLAPYVLERTDDGWIIRALEERDGPLELDGFFGFGPPTYDRVNGMIATWGAAYRFPRIGLVAPSLHASAGYATERGEPLGAIAATLAGRRARLFAGAERTVFTNEAWIRGALHNSLSYLLKGKDYRDYYQADRLYTGLAYELPFGGAAVELSGLWQLEDATSLRADDPWSLLSPDSVRPNLGVSDGTIGSAVLAATTDWVGASAALELDARAEIAGTALGGDFDFARYQIAGEWAMRALANHTLEVEWMFMGPIGDEVLPLQRWSFVGGSGTLTTFDLAQFRGDRVAFVGTDYIIPLRRFAIPLLGPPEFKLVHRVGMAWTRDVERDLEQNVGVRLDIGFVYVRLLVDPDVPGEPDFSVGVAWPFGERYPWAK